MSGITLAGGYACLDRGWVILAGGAGFGEEGGGLWLLSLSHIQQTLTITGQVEGSKMNCRRGGASGSRTIQHGYIEDPQM